MNQQMLAQQQQIQQLSDRFAQLGVDQQVMMQEMRRVQKTAINHEQVIHCVMNYLHTVDSRLKRGADLSPSAVNDEPSAPLEQATKLLNELQSEIQYNINSMESIADMQSRMSGPVPTPPLDQAQRNGIIRPPTSAGSSSTLGYSKLNGGELEAAVYPVGVTNGIDPMFGDHVNNIPYALPQQKEVDLSDPRRQYMDGRKKSMYTNPGWIRPPRILLVEDDQTCRQIGGKFIQSFCCMVDTAVRFPPDSRSPPISNC